MKKSTLKKSITWGIFILLALLIFNSFYVFGLDKGLNQKIGETKELTKPAELELTSISTSCADCFDINPIVTVLKEADLKILKEKNLKSSSVEAQSLIEKYKIEKLPTIILTGEIEKASIQNFKQQDEALIFEGLSPPYVEAATGKVVGRVSSLIIEDKNCEVCSDLDLILQNLEESQVIFSEQKTIDYSSAEGKKLMTKFSIEKIPALLLSSDIEAYSVAQNLNQAGFLLNEDYYIVESPAPYVEAKTGKLRGLVSLTMIDDQSCSQCYDVNIHKQILARVGLTFDEEKTIDINSAEGVQLRLKYKLKKVPTVILTGDVEAYTDFDQLWQQVGTVEDDGAYVFRELEAMGQDIIYKDLTNNQISGLATGITSE